MGLAAGVGLFLAFWSWVGFEAAPNYAEESRDPVRNVPRATLYSVVGLGIGYVITSMAFVSAFPERTLVKDAQNPDGPFFAAMDNFGTHGLTTIMQILILTGSFACAMAFHNVAMRYFYAMGREGILPRALGRTHRTHKSPYIASLAQTGFAVALVLVWAIGAGFGDAYNVAYVRIYTMMAVQGVVWILAIQALCALAVITYHRRAQAHRLVLDRRRLPGDRDPRPGVRALSAVQEHRRARGHDLLRRRDRADRGRRRDRRARATR